MMARNNLPQTVDSAPAPPDDEKPSPHWPFWMIVVAVLLCTVSMTVGAIWVAAPLRTIANSATTPEPADLAKIAAVTARWAYVALGGFLVGITLWMVGIAGYLLRGRRK